MIQRIKVRVRNRMTGKKASSGTHPGNVGTVLWQHLVHRLVSPARWGPYSDRTRAWIDAHRLVGREQYWETVWQAPVWEHCFPSLSNERSVLMISCVCVSGNILWHHLDKAPKALGSCLPWNQPVLTQPLQIYPWWMYRASAQICLGNIRGEVTAWSQDPEYPSFLLSGGHLG